MNYLLLLSILLLSLNLNGFSQSTKYYGGSKKINDSIRTILEDMETPTFQNRGNYFKGVQQYGVDSKQAKALLRQMALDDSLNLMTVERLYNMYGWPKVSQLGLIATNQAFLQIQHGPFKTMLKYLPILRKVAKEGEFPKNSLALIEDRVLTYKHKKQLYGTQRGLRYLKDGTRVGHIWPIKSYPNVKKINKRRAKMGIKMGVEEEFDLTKYDPNVSLNDFKKIENN